MKSRCLKKKLDDYALAQAKSEDPIRIDSLVEGLIRNNVNAFYKGSAKKINKFIKYYEKCKLEYDGKI